MKVPVSYTDLAPDILLVIILFVRNVAPPSQAYAHATVLVLD